MPSSVFCLPNRCVNCDTLCPVGLSRSLLCSNPLQAFIEWQLALPLNKFNLNHSPPATRVQLHTKLAHFGRSIQCMSNDQMCTTWNDQLFTFVRRKFPVVPCLCIKVQLESTRRRSKCTRMSRWCSVDRRVLLCNRSIHRTPYARH